MTRSGLDAAKRIANGFDERKTELRTASVTGSIDCQTEGCRRQLG